MTYYPLVHFFSLRHVFPNMADQVQLDRLQTDHELSGHVRYVQRDRYYIGYQHFLSFSIFHQKPSDQSR